jgi:hypothetical protein
LQMILAIDMGAAFESCSVSSWTWPIADDASDRHGRHSSRAACRAGHGLLQMMLAIDMGGIRVVQRAEPDMTYCR